MATRAPGYRVCLQRRSRQPDLVLLSCEPLLKLQSQLLVGAAILLEGVGDKWLRLNKSIGVQPLAHDNGRSEALRDCGSQKVGPFFRAESAGDCPRCFVIEPRQLQSQRMFTGFVIDHEIGKAIQHSTHFSCSARKPFGQIADWARGEGSEVVGGSHQQAS